MLGETPIVNQLFPDLSVLSIKTRVVASVPYLKFLLYNPTILRSEKKL